MSVMIFFFRLLQPKTSKLVCSEWLDGLDCFQAEKIISVGIGHDTSTVVTASFRSGSLRDEELKLHILTAQTREPR